MKYIEVRTSTKKSVASMAVLAILAVTPLIATVPAANAQPGNGRWGNNKDVTITGTVLDSQNQRDVVRIQDSNGNIYTAETNNAESFRVGQRVEATGRLRGSVIRNASVKRANGGWNGGGWNGGGNNNTTVRGTVIDSLNQVNVVRIQDSKGRIYTANTSSAERFRVGETVEITGRLRGSSFRDATVRRIGGGGWNGGGNQNVTIIGTVVDSLNQTNVVRIRQNNGGRIYTAQTGRAERFTVGETVEAKGYLRGTDILSATVRRIGNNGGGSTTRIDFSGYVVDSGNQVNILRVRAENGTTYTVSTTSAARYRVNDRVRVTGNYNGSLVTGASINRN